MRVIQKDTDNDSYVGTYNASAQVLQSYGRDIYTIDTTQRQYPYSNTKQAAHIIWPL